jgi:hypothetical protein
MSGFSIRAFARYFLKGIMITVLSSCTLQEALNNPDLINDGNGNFHPRPGYVWVNPSDRGDMRTMPDPNLSSESQTATVDSIVAQPQSTPTPEGNSAENRFQKIADDQAKASESYASKDVINWVELEPSSIPRTYRGPIHFRVNLIGSAARRGSVFVGGTLGNGCCSVFGARVSYEPGENMVEGDIQVVAGPRSGTATITASVYNVYSADSRASALLEIE